MNKHFEVIIVGGGISGILLAKLLSQNNVDCLVIERGNSIGDKGSYNQLANRDILKELNLEKKYEKEKIGDIKDCFLGDGRDTPRLVSTSIDGIENDPLYLLQRKNFLNELIKKIDGNNVLTKTNTIVNELIIENEKIIGVRTDKEDIFSNLVILAEGGNSLLLKKTGLRKGEARPEETVLFIEEVVEVDPLLVRRKLELDSSPPFLLKIFSEHINEKDSLAYVVFSQNLLSFTLGISLAKLILLDKNINLILEEIKSNPLFCEIVKDKKTLSFSSYILPSVIHRKDLPKLCVDGCLVIGAATMAIAPTSLDLIQDVYSSAQIAVNAIIKAKKLNDFSRKILTQYEGEVIKLLDKRNKGLKAPVLLEK